MSSYLQALSGMLFGRSSLRQALYGVKKVVCRGNEIYEILFWCYKTKDVGVFLCLSSFLSFFFFFEDLATLTLYHTAHERS